MTRSTEFAVFVIAVGGLTWCVAAAPVFAQPILQFDTALTALNLTGGPVGLPLASDPGNALGDSIEGYGFVNSQVTVTLSSQRSESPGPPSLGEACAFPGAPASPGAGGGAGAQCGGEDPLPIDPSELDGEEYYVQSFFDVFFDITVTDVDARPGRDFAGQSDGAVIALPDNGPANMQSFHNAVFDASAPNFGLIPPSESAPYIGHFNIEIPLGGDINGNGEPDKIKFTVATHAAGDENRTFIILPDGTVIDSFDSIANLAGAVVDISSDPPFSIDLAGPTTATSRLVNPVVPEPAGLGLLVAAAMLVSTFFRKGRGGS